MLVVGRKRLEAGIVLVVVLGNYNRVVVVADTVGERKLFIGVKEEKNMRFGVNEGCPRFLVCFTGGFL